MDPTTPDGDGLQTTMAWGEKETNENTTDTGSATPALESSTTKFRIPANWAQAPEFVPRAMKPNWADAAEFVPRNDSSDLIAEEELPSCPTPNDPPVSAILPEPQVITQPTAVVGTLDATFRKVELPASSGNQPDRLRLSWANNWYHPNAVSGVALLPIPVAVPVRHVKLTAEMAERALCPYAIIGECRYGVACRQVHGDICDLCGQFALHPDCPEQNEAHRKSCLEQHERNMEFSFAMAQSAERQCDICYDVIMDKENVGDQRFGILPGCSHCYCLSCIRKWRLQSRQFETRVCRACPMCRVMSDFVVPSRYWMDTEEDKQKLIESYKKAMSVKPCRYFNGGNGFCPFAGRCFYMHKVEEEVDPNGESSSKPSTVPSPGSRQNSQHSSTSADGGSDDMYFDDSDDDW